MESKFKIGDKVKIKGKSKTYTIKDVKYTNYSHRFYYFLEEDKLYFHYEDKLERKI